MKKLKNGKSRQSKILQSNGKEWSEVGNAIMQTFSEWLDFSDMDSTKFFERVNGDTFSIKYIHEPDKTEIQLTDNAGTIGVAFPWDSENGIPFEHYITDAGLFLCHIGGLCHNEKSIKTINDFLCKIINL